MISNTNPFSLKAQSAGPIASRILGTRAKGTVVALFERCFYIDVDSLYLCIGASDFPMGPLHISTDAPSTTSWLASGLNVGDPVYVTQTHIKVGALIQLQFNQITRWQPTTVHNTRPSRKSIDQIRACYLRHSPMEGFAPLIFNGNNSDLPQASRPLSNLADWLNTYLSGTHSRAEQPPISEILGMGPGLTPSGDDFIAAMVLTLSWLGEHTLVGLLARAVRNQAPGATNPISAQHLYAACEGYGSETLHHVLWALGDGALADQTIALNALTDMGYTSGWDAIAGLYSTLDIWHNVQHTKTIAA